MIEYYELVTVSTEWVTADLIVWKRYRMRAIGILEKLLDANPHLSVLHRSSPFLPVGTQIRIPIDPDILRGQPQPQQLIRLWNSSGSLTTRVKGG